ncbi:MAG: YHS domain-containing protein [Phormidesmis sp. RL_2_1]|nr:YHS domain-containing protein [Phormidesmis sp. RL_2_1]
MALGLAACSPPETVTAPSTDGASAETASAETASAETASAETASAETADATLYVKDGVAISGADAVAYFTESAFVPGSAEYTYEWQGASWQFSSAENRDTFAQNPEQYAPQYGGFCAWAIAAKKALVPTDPNAWKVVDGKLYLNANSKVQSQWEKDIPGFIATGDENWPAVSQ